MSRQADEALELLAHACGVAVSYIDADRRLHAVSPDTLVAVLASLGEPIEGAGDAPECLARRAAAREPPPVVVAWQGRLGRGVLERQGLRGEHTELELEDGSDGTGLLRPTGRRAVVLPFGHHRLRSGAASTQVISAPLTASQPAPWSWGAFSPTYALWDARPKQAGNLTCLARLGAFIGSLGGSYLATLPLLADYSSAEGEATVSPYSPISRMWWNEAYLDLSLLPGMDEAPSSPDMAADAGGGAPAERRYADIAGAATRVDNTLARLVAGQHPGRGPRRRDYERFLRDRPDVRRYAAFRAAAAIAGTDTASWPASWASGDIRPGRDVPEAAAEVHICAQWLTDSQVAEAAARAASAGCRLMPDLPLGSRPDGYDPWAFPSSYADASLSRSRGRTSVGAPPDHFFSSGQNWGFRPLHPDGERRAGYPVVLGSLRHLLRHAGALRIDHILGFQRLWWIPPGASPAEGTYVAYPGEELAALACLESWRHDAALIGEDLGTVDPGIRRLMRRHGICGMSVAVFELGGGGRLLRPRPGSCALVDTHDTATFAGWLDGDDIDARDREGALGAAEAASAYRWRSNARHRLAARLGVGPSDARAMHAALLEELGASDAAVVMANLEDLWGEPDPQNVPGTTSEHHNFARRLAKSLGALETDPEVLRPLLALDAARRTRSAGSVEGTPASAGKGDAVELRACDAPATGTMGR